MNFLSKLKTEVSDIEAKLESMVPAELKAKYGAYAHTIVANLMNDAEDAVKSGIAEAKQLSAPMIHQAISTIESLAEAEAKSFMSGNVSFSAAVSNVISGASSDVTKTLAPALKVVGQETLSTVARASLHTAVAAVAGNPTSSPVKSSSVSSPASSKPSAPAPAKK